MKTREKILLTSLALFNEEGEPGVTTVDIANELDISPGNLYYHFRGKEEIIAELYEAFEVELKDILNAPLEKGLNAQDAWFYLYIVFEHIFNHRYLYRNLNDLLHRYPGIKRRFSQLMELKIAAALAVIEELVNKGFVEISSVQKARLVDSITLNLTYWLNYTQLRAREANNEIMIHEGVFQLVSLASPYLRPEFRYFYDECCALFDALVHSA